MKRISSKEIKKVVFGIIISDGYIAQGGRIDLYNKNQEYILFVKNILENITRTRCSIYKKHDNRFNVDGYRITSNQNPYFKKIREIFYDQDGKKHLSKYIVDRIDFQCLAHIWMCDGYMYHAKNKNKNKIQNIGYLCLEGFQQKELEILINRLEKMGISSRLEKVDWGYGNRIKISGKSLQIFIDGIFQYIIPCFLYKTTLYYKSSVYLDSDLQSAEQYVKYYDDVEDIVRHS